MALLSRQTLAVALLAAITARCGRPSGESPDLAGARQLYFSRGCAACHGPEGAGDGPAAATLRRRPRDLRDAASYDGPHDEAAIARVIATGLGVKEGGMPPQPYLPEGERRLLARYVLSLAQGPAPSKGP